MIGPGSAASHRSRSGPRRRFARHLDRARGGPAGEQPGLPHRIADTAARAAKSLAIVLVLMIAAVGFVLIQDRFDKKDPRLALAPLQSDVARFD